MSNSNKGHEPFETERGPRPMQVAAGLVFMAVILAGGTVAVFASITPYDWSLRADRLLALRLAAVAVVTTVFLGLWGSAMTAYPRRVVPVTTWLVLLALLWGMAAFEGSSFAWQAACLIGPVLLSLLLVPAEIQRQRAARPR